MPGTAIRYDTGCLYTPYAMLGTDVPNGYTSLDDTGAEGSCTLRRSIPPIVLGICYAMPGADLASPSPRSATTFLPSSWRACGISLHPAMRAMAARY
eukprot:3874521-Rhodomonas_salina.3